MTSRHFACAQPAHRLDDLEARVADVERQIEALRRSNAKLDTRNALLVRLASVLCAMC